MRKLIIIIFMFIYAVLSLNVAASNYKVCVDGQEYSMINPIIYEEKRISLSLRDVANIMKGELSWDNDSKTAILSVPYGAVKFQVDNGWALNILSLHVELKQKPLLRKGLLYVSVEDLNALFLTKIECSNDMINIDVVDTNTSYSFSELIPEYELVDSIGFVPGSLAEFEFIYSSGKVPEVMQQFSENEFKISSNQELRTGGPCFIFYSADDIVSMVSIYGNNRVRIKNICYEIATPLIFPSKTSCHYIRRY
ncbi:hypothetical protein CS063_03150 [Sporanaerobium hydrogeniformans]|uniref:Uncharacterized protein n=1 Tax=Sporanaerobium hydrogeniformans TaxID=3072179 RepID=A0AC61DF82_9FIRM|nr:stalk domain-containing protein [Sporanaerobium hydrogeniformans]PHV71577.1 hypothetical protein CS063_03150 [Sporanaerobium hydrogeniformans]